MSKRYEINLPEIGIDKDHIHFPYKKYQNIVYPRSLRIIKNITAKKIFVNHPEVKEELWGSEFWSDGFFVNTVSKFGS